MGRSRYLITEPDKPHFMTCTVLAWLPVFTRPETFNIIVDCWRYQQLARRNCETLVWVEGKIEQTTQLG